MQEADAKDAIAADVLVRTVNGSKRPPLRAARLRSRANQIPRPPPREAQEAAEDKVFAAEPSDSIGAARMQSASKVLSIRAA
jgi:hypothetical protein